MDTLNYGAWIKAGMDSIMIQEAMQQQLHHQANMDAIASIACLFGIAALSMLFFIFAAKLMP